MGGAAVAADRQHLALLVHADGAQRHVAHLDAHHRLVALLQKVPRFHATVFARREEHRELCGTPAAVCQLLRPISTQNLRNKIMFLLGFF